ncbi:hypothetical protein VitviT2T_016809 [Vitis vinifera]|nr:hypothetical protein VitviT2T_016809 [Vitis vinifera]
MVASLKLHSKAAALSEEAKRRRVESKSNKVSPKKKPKTESPIVIRRSLRTRGLPPDFSSGNGLKDEFVESMIKGPKSPSTPEGSKSPSLPEGPLSIRDRVFLDKILGVSKESQLRNSDKCSADDEVDEKKPLDCLIKRESRGGVEGSVDLGSMTLNAENIARIMPGRIMNLRFFPCIDSTMIVAGDKSGHIGFWDVDCEKERDGVFLYQPHKDPVSGILIQEFSQSKIFTSCYGGSIQLMDAEKEVFDKIYSSESAIFSLSQRPNYVNCLYFGEGNGGLNLWDMRAGKEPSSSWPLHEYRINTIDFNINNPNIMATSSSDATACIWDLRKIDSDKPKTLKTVSHARAVHSAYFSPSGSSLATTSVENKVGLLGGVNFEDLSMIYHENHMCRWISSFRAIWGWDDSYLFIGNMKRGVDIISTACRKTVMTLQSAHMSAIPCRFSAHPYKVGMLAGATGGGQIYMWKSC